MAFVNEPMGEAGVRLIKSLEIIDPLDGIPYSDAFPYQPKDYWMVDHKRNLVFFGMGGRGRSKEEPPQYYCLVWQNYPIRIELYRSFTGNITTGFNMILEIDRIYAPLELNNVPKNQICRAIREAFEFYEPNRNPNVKSISFPDMSEIILVSRKSMWRCF